MLAAETDSTDDPVDRSSPLDRALSRLAAAPPPSPVPVLVLSGFLGAGKTTLLQRVLTGHTGLRLAVLVNDMAEINIDARLVASTTAATATQERVVELTNGCICCTLRDDLLTEVSRMAGALAIMLATLHHALTGQLTHDPWPAEGVYDYIIIESTGISEPMPVAATFTTPVRLCTSHAHALAARSSHNFRPQGRDGTMLSQYAPLDSMLTVVDAATALAELQSEDLLATRGLAAQEGDQRCIASLMVQQIECADTCACPIEMRMLAYDLALPLNVLPTRLPLSNTPQCWSTSATWCHRSRRRAWRPSSGR